MTFDPPTAGLEERLGVRPAAALLEWAATRSRSVRLASPQWVSHGYTGAVLAAINVTTPGQPDAKVIVKVCPPGPYARETAAHHLAKVHSANSFFARHLVAEAYDPYPTGDGGFLTFQELASGSFNFRPMSQVAEAALPAVAATVVKSVLTEWNRASVRTGPSLVGRFLTREIRGALDAGGSVAEWAARARLLDDDRLWLTTAEDDQTVPNPMLMPAASALGAKLELDVVLGPTHGDLHLDNVLVPEEFGSLQAADFWLIDLATFETAAPLTRDPVMLLLSVIAPRVSQLRPEEQRALLELVVQPWSEHQTLIAPFLAGTVSAIYHAGHEAIKEMRLGDWRPQFLLSVLATALLFTTYESIGEAGRWWFFRLAGRAGAEFLRIHHAYRPGSPTRTGQPRQWHGGRVRASLVDSAAEPSARWPRTRSVPLKPAGRQRLIALLRTLPADRLEAVYREVVGSAVASDPSDWHEHGALERRLESLAHEGTEIPRLLAFLDGVAHWVTGVASTSGQELHALIDVAVGRLGLTEDDARSLCAETSSRSQRGEDFSGSPDAAMAVDEDSLQPPLKSGDADMTAVNAPLLAGTQEALNAPRRRRIVRVPQRNPDFTGREDLLRRLANELHARSTASVVPQALHGLGGVGKTQLAIEYIHRYVDQYDLVWWISAEEQSQVRSALAALGERLDIDIPVGQDMQQTAVLVLDALIATSDRWLLVYDNVGSPEGIADLLPAMGGHVIVTSRNYEAFATGGNAIEVDVFARIESIELLRKHRETMTEEDANKLAEKLGDLPLALEQAAIWHAATGMPVSEYLELFDKNVLDLMSEGKPRHAERTIYAILKMAFDKLRADLLAAAQLLELFAHLGPEPVSVTMLRRGRDADITEPLRSTLRKPIDLNRVVRELRRYGLAKVDPNGQRIQVHRLIHLVLREELRSDRLRESRTNVQRLLASANPGYPDEQANWPMHAEIGPHIRAAELIAANDDTARLVVLDQLRYLFRKGDYEASRALGEVITSAWVKPPAEGGLGPDHELTLIANRHLGDALRLLGETDRAHALDVDTLERLKRNPEFGEEHEHTLYMANSVAVDLRIAGKFREARALDDENVARHLRFFGEEDEHTLRTKNNLAVSLRLLGEYAAAHDIDTEVLDQWRKRLGATDTRTLLSIVNLASDLYGMGRYRDALEQLQKSWETYLDQLGPRHSEVLVAARMIVIALRKSGEHGEAKERARENYLHHSSRFGADHPHTLAATMSYANTLRAVDELSEARGLANEAVGRYRRVFGARHPLALAANTNLAIILRSLGEMRQARAMDDETLSAMTAVLGETHPYTLSVATGLANDLVLAHKLAEAKDLSAKTLAVSRRIRGEDHPDTLACATNAARDLQATGAEQEGLTLLTETLAKLARVLGSVHPETLDAGRGKRAECDIEPPPT